MEDSERSTFVSQKSSRKRIHKSISSNNNSWKSHWGKKQAETRGENRPRCTKLYISSFARCLCCYYSEWWGFILKLNWSTHTHSSPQHYSTDNCFLFSILTIKHFLFSGMDRGASVPSTAAAMKFEYFEVKFCILTHWLATLTTLIQRVHVFTWIQVVTLLFRWTQTETLNRN